MRIAAILLLGLLPLPALGWGHTGHVEITRIAMDSLAPDLPDFLHAAPAIAMVAELGAEPDELRTTGAITSAPGAPRTLTARTAHDAEHDPAHFINIDDAGLVRGGVVRLDALPPTREAFDTAQRTATDPAAQTQYTAGYLPYAILDGFLQLRKDFAIWRLLQVGLRTAPDAEARTWFTLQSQIRETVLLRDIGVWSHFVADGSQPLHVSVHSNGWGRGPNPRGFTTTPIHAAFEGEFVRRFADWAAVRAALPPPHDCACPIEQRIPAYLAQSLAAVESLYEAAGSGPDANLFRTADPASMTVVTRNLARGAAELRDMIADAWHQSAGLAAGYPLVAVRDAEAGRAAVTRLTFGAD